jgi:small GTP-binding protein
MKNIVLKVLIAGDAGVGKTTMLHRYVEGEFIDSMTMTIGVDFHTKPLQIDDKNCHLQLWDLGGQERFRFMHEAYLRGAHGALLLYDTTNYVTFVNIEKWIQLLRKLNPDLPVILVATKYDLEEFSMVGDYLAELTKKRFKMIDYVKTSSKWGLNIETPFNVITKYLIELTVG